MPTILKLRSREEALRPDPPLPPVVRGGGPLPGYAHLAAAQGRKLGVLVRAVERAKRVVVTCSCVGELPWRLLARIEPRIPRIVPLGVGGRTFDATYILVAVALVFLVIAGLHAYVFLAAAVRHLFWDIRMRRARMIPWAFLIPPAKAL